MKKSLMVVLAVAALVAFTVPVMAAEGAPGDKPEHKHPEGIFGTIKSIDLDGKKLVVLARAAKDAEPAETTVEFTDQTKVSIDKKDATVADLKEGMKCFITPKTGPAEKIMVRTTEGGGHGKKKPNDKPGEEK